MADMPDPDFENIEGIETHPIGDLAAAMMEVIEAQFGPNAKVGLVGIVAQVTYPVGGDASTDIVAWSNVGPPWVQEALFEQGARVTRDGG